MEQVGAFIAGWFRIRAINQAIGAGELLAELENSGARRGGGEPKADSAVCPQCTAATLLDGDTLSWRGNAVRHNIQRTCSQLDICGHIEHRRHNRRAGGYAH